MSNEPRQVYSTEKEHISSISKGKPASTRNDSICRVRRETKGRAGKIATVIWNTPVSDNELKSLCTAIKKRLGTGGSTDNGQIVIQGDHVDMIIGFLKSKGFCAKKAGG